MPLADESKLKFRWVVSFSEFSDSLFDCRAFSILMTIVRESAAMANLRSDITRSLSSNFGQSAMFFFPRSS